MTNGGYTISPTAMLIVNAAVYEGMADLSAASWQDVPHSDDGNNAFVVDYLDYSTPAGDDRAIFVDAAQDKGFWRVRRTGPLYYVC